MSKAMKKQKRGLLPRLRFPEFMASGEWEPSTLGKLFANRQESGFESLPLLSLTAKEGIIPQEESNRKNNASADRSRYLRVVPGDIAYNTMRMWEGRSAYVDREGVISPAYTVCEPVGSVNGLFFSYYFKTAQLIEQFRRYSQGLVKDTLNLKYAAFSKIPVLFPSSEEQQKIADCLSSLDALIAAQADKLDVLKSHKKWLMQQFFPREGETVPRLRFPEFRDAGEWEEVEFSTQITLISGLHLSPNQYADTGEVPYFTGPSDYTNNLDLVSKWTERSTNIGRAGDTLITVKGSGVGELLLLELEEVAMGRQLMAVRPQGAHGGFIFYFLAMQRQRLTVLASGNLIPGLSRGDILSLTLLAPEPEEQQKIADCLSSADALIAAQVEKLDALKTHKKSLMQQFFPNSAEVGV